jgi:hypothetical protein
MQTYIDIEYGKIMKKIRGGKLFNTPIDINNHRMLIVAVYHMARGEEIQNK